MSARRQRLRAIEHADFVEPEKSACEKVMPLGILAVHPPGEVEQQLVERAREELTITLTAVSGHLVDAPDGPRMHWRVHVAERELVGGNLTVRMHVPLAQQENQLVFRE